MLLEEPTWGFYTTSVLEQNHEQVDVPGQNHIRITIGTAGAKEAASWNRQASGPIR